MLPSLPRQLGQPQHRWLMAFGSQQLRWWSPRPNSSRGKSPLRMMPSSGERKSEWWVVDGEMHEAGENVPPRERFVLPRDNLPNKRRKQLREQFMRRTRLVLKETEHEPWCKRYMELYQELRENWERLYWDEGYSKKIAQDHASYESAEDDDLDFLPYRRRQSHFDQSKHLLPCIVEVLQTIQDQISVISHSMLINFFQDPHEQMRRNGAPF